jgi:hypothetical protein
VVAKCANPVCSATFHRLGEGRLFINELRGDPGDTRGHSRQLRCFWLCDSCCLTMTIVTEAGQEIKLAPWPVPASAARAAV